MAAGDGDLESGPDFAVGQRGARLKSKTSVFFSEEKNQKTFHSALAEACRPWPDTWEAA
jgi:hypothetical protein